MGSCLVYRFRYLKHSKRFEDRIYQTLDEGKKYPLIKLNLYNSSPLFLMHKGDSGQQSRLETLILYSKIEFKPVPLDQLSRCPATAWNEIYNDPEFWSEEKLGKYLDKFDNIAATFGATSVKDENYAALYLHCIDIDSENVLK